LKGDNSKQFEEEYYSEGDPSMGEKSPIKEQLEAHAA